MTGTKDINAIANMTYLDWSDNSSISSSAPADYWPTMSSRIPENRLKTQVHLHALPVGWEQLDYPTFLERRRDLMAKVVREGFEALWADAPRRTEVTVPDLISSGESQTLEFKSTARVNLHTKQTDPRMEHVIVKTVCGLLNAEGGRLLIGVDDSGSILGLDEDMASLGNKGNPDGYELHLRQLLDANLSSPTVHTVRIRFDHIENRTICVISVAASGKPVFAKPVKGSGDEFWVRTGNATKQYHGEGLVDYIDSHWG